MIVHGDAAETENLWRILTDWLLDMGLIPAGHLSLIDCVLRYQS